MRRVGDDGTSVGACSVVLELVVTVSDTAEGAQLPGLGAANTADTVDELPTDVCLDRLTGEMGGGTTAGTGSDRVNGCLPLRTGEGGGVGPNMEPDTDTPPERGDNMYPANCCALRMLSPSDATSTSVSVTSDPRRVREGPGERDDRLDATCFNSRFRCLDSIARTALASPAATAASLTRSSATPRWWRL